MRSSLAVILTLIPCLAAAEAPLSAIDWLDSRTQAPVIVAPRPSAQATQKLPVAQSATVPTVTVTPLDGPSSNAVGLLSASVTGLPVTLWQASEEAELSRLIRAQHAENIPPLQSLFYTLLLAEADGPHDAASDASFLITRIDSLMSAGAVEQAQALLARVNPDTPDLFGRWFNATLLTGDEDTACTALMRAPHLAPSYEARVFCTARRGDWTTASILLDTARAIGQISSPEDTLLAHFLDADLIETVPLARAPVRPSALVFRLYEAIGEPLPTATLPRAFAVADLRDTAGWKAQIEAAERLTKTGALSENRLIGIYSERLPAASGGVWDRVDAVQRFDIAMTSRDPGAVAVALAPAWHAMRVAGLSDAFARLYGAKLMELPLRGTAAELAYRIALLAPEFETIATTKGADFPALAFVTSIALGTPSGGVPQSGTDGTIAIQTAIARAFETATLPENLMALFEQGRLGEVILNAMLLYQDGIVGNPRSLETGLSAMRFLGLETIARRAAIDLLLSQTRF